MAKTNTPQVKIVNCETGEEIVRDANEAEIAEIEINAANLKSRQNEASKKETAKAAILDRIGLTADELKSILG